MIDSAMAQLHAAADGDYALYAAAYHKTVRPYLGIKVPVVDAMADEWRAQCSLADRLTLAAALWDSNIHEARIGAAKLLTQARIKPEDDGAWALIQSWVPQFDAWAISDHTCKAAEKRITADPLRINAVQAWTTSDNMWVRRAALVATLPFAKQNFPKPVELQIRDQVLGWAAGYCDDRDWFIQKAVAWWLRDLSKHDVPRVTAFLADHGDRMKPFARKEAAQYL